MIYSQKRKNASQNKVQSSLILYWRMNQPCSAKVQSALLEAMQERQVTISCVHIRITVSFPVMATQNPIEQEEPHPLSQVDRFMLKRSFPSPNHLKMQC